MAESTLPTAGLGFGSLRARLHLLGLGSLIGLVAGMGSFMFIKNQLMPWGVGKAWALLLIVVAGAYAHFLARDLAESVAMSLVAVAVGLAFHVAAWIAPLWMLPYPPSARGLLLPRMVGRALMSALLAYLVTFYSSYFAAMLIGGYLDG